MTTPDPRSLSTDAIQLYRDDGPVSLLVGRLHFPVPWLTALIALAVPSSLSSLGLPRGVLLAAVVWAVIVGGIGSLDPHTRRLDWLAVPLLRTGEYSVIAVAGLAGDVSPPLVFALLCAVAFHDYDTVDRIRQGRAASTRRRAPVRLLGLGWDGRLLVVGIGFATGQATAVYIAMTAYLWVLFAAESAGGWLHRDAAV